MGNIVAKFGGTSLASAAQFEKVREIVLSDPRRKYIVASAPGKRFPEDVKVTDLLLSCYHEAAAGEDFSEPLAKVSARFREIIDDLHIDFPLEKEIGILRDKLMGRRTEIMRRAAANI